MFSYASSECVSGLPEKMQDASPPNGRFPPLRTADFGRNAKNKNTMETETKMVKEKEIVHDDSYEHRHAVDNSARALGIVGTVAGGLALLGGLGRNRGGLFGGSYAATPETVNINNAAGGSASGSGASAPSPFEAWEKESHDILALTNEIWGLKLNTQQQMYDHRQTDIDEKFRMYKGQRDADDAIVAKVNADMFALYKGQRDSFDALKAQLDEMKCKLAVDEAVRPYQDRLIQCQIEQAYKDGINYVDRKTCKMISGQVVLPSTPTVTGYGSYSACACPATAAAPAA